MWCNIVQRSLRPSSFFHSCFFFTFPCDVSTYSCLLLIHSSTSFILLLIPSRVLFSYCCSLCLQSLSLFSISCIFSVCTSILFWGLGHHTLLSLPWILFSVVPISLLGVLEVSLCSTSSVTSFCHPLAFCFVFVILLLRLQDCNSSWFWCLFTVAWLVRGLCRLSVMMDGRLPLVGGLGLFWWDRLSKEFVCQGSCEAHRITRHCRHWWVGLCSALLIDWPENYLSL